MKKYPNLIGQVFGRLTVIDFAGIAESGHPLWKCKCICNKELVVRGSSLISSNTKSCGCLRSEVAFKRHCLEYGEGAFNLLYAKYVNRAKRKKWYR